MRPLAFYCWGEFVTYLDQPFFQSLQTERIILVAAVAIDSRQQVMLESKFLKSIKI